MCTRHSVKRHYSKFTVNIVKWQKQPPKVCKIHWIINVPEYLRPETCNVTKNSEFCEVFKNTFLRNIIFLRSFQISSFWGQGQKYQNYQINIFCFRVTSEPKNRHHIEPELFPKKYEILVKNTLFSDRQLVLRTFCPTPHTTLLFLLFIR